MGFLPFLQWFVEIFCMWTRPCIRGIRPPAWLRWNGPGVALVPVCGHWVLSFCIPVLGPGPQAFCRSSGRNAGTRWAFSSPLGLVGRCQYRRSVWLCPGVQFYPIPCVCVCFVCSARSRLWWVRVEQFSDTSKAAQELLSGLVGYKVSFILDLITHQLHVIYC